MLSIPAAVEAVSNAIKSVFDFASTAKENQSETEIIKEKRDLEDAVNTAEEIIELFGKYQTYLSDDDWKSFKKLVKKFNKKD